MERTRSPRETAGSVAAGLLVLFPSMVVGGFMPELNVLPLVGWLAVTSLGGLVAGGLFAEQAPIAGAVGGLVSGALAPFLVTLYTDLRVAYSATFFTLEFIIPGAVAFVPGWGIYQIGKRALGR